MAQISYAGLFNSAALIVSDVYLNVLQPQGSVIRPAAVGLLAIVGVASWGPVNVATPVGSPSALALFGTQQVRKYDLATAANIALQIQSTAKSGSGLILNRVTDGTDTAATGAIGLIAAPTLAAGGTGYVANDTITLTNGVVLKVATVNAGAVATVTVVTAAATGQPSNPVAQASTSGAGTGATFNLTYTKQLGLTSIYTGSGGNPTTATIAPGSAPNSWKIIIQLPGTQPEVFDNISGSGLALWTAIASAINTGNSPQRGPSKLVIATAGTLTTAPAAGTTGMSGGTDGAGSIASDDLVGVDGATRTGVFVFRGSGASHGHIADFDDSTQNANLTAFAQSEGIYWGYNGPMGQTPVEAADQKATDGTDTPWLKPFLGDWAYANDNVNGGERLLGPATFGMAQLSTLPPQQVGLNKQVQLVVATQRSKSGSPYDSSTDLLTLTNAGIEVICNPIPRGPMFGMRIGRNASSDGTRNTDNWPVLTSFIVRSMAGPGCLGPAIGEVITDDYFDTWYAVLDGFLSGLQRAQPQAVIQNYQINFSRANNPQSQTDTGLVVAEVLIQYFGIAQVFLVNLQTGATVVIPVSQSSFAQAA